MSNQVGTFTMGVEEEYQIVDAETRESSSSSLSLLTAAQDELGQDAQSELQLSQIEAITPVCQTLQDVRTELLRLRQTIATSAQQQKKHIIATGTHPFSHWKEQRITPKSRYWGIAGDYQQVAREPISGCHVHIGLQDHAVALQVMNRARLWIAPLLALTANSPFWMGEDTGYASFRTIMWTRWPTSGLPQYFQSLDEYHDLLDALVAVGRIEDPTKIYWDIRISERFNTLEFRVSDVCMTIEETLMLVGLIRALVRTCHEQVLRDDPLPTIRYELLRVAQWQAARYGLSGELVDVFARSTPPAAEVVGKLLDFLRPALKAEGDWDQVSELVQTTLQRGNGAARQVEVYQRTQRMEDVVDYIVQETVKGGE